MKKIIFLYREECERNQNLLSKLENEFSVVSAHSYQEAIKILNFFTFAEVAAIIVDCPSKEPKFTELENYIENKNSFMFSLPIVISTDEENVKEDEKYLNDNIVAIILGNESQKIVCRRIESVIKFSNSTSFDKFSEMLKRLPSLIYLKDNQGRYAFCSQDWHHVKDKDVRGKTDFDIRKDKNNARIAQESDMKVVVSGKGTSYIIKEDDEEGVDYLQIIKEPLKNANGDVTGIVAIINNVTEEELLRQELRKKSITDNLTGLYNREYFEELATKYGDTLPRPLTIISVDCDDLKSINDRFGHASGDEYIRMARDVLKSTLPEGSHLFRMGGDEFIAVVPATSAEQAAELIDKIMEKTENCKNDKFALKMSVGSYTINKGKVSIDEALAKSDKSMYKMKSEHRSQK